MRIISGDAASLPGDMVTRVARYRHEVFVRRLGWTLGCPDGWEYDQFDREDTVHVVALDKRTGEIRGVARLLPTTRPYLLSEVFPGLLHGLPAPASAKIWELSRFAAVNVNARCSTRNGQFSSRAAMVLLRATLMCAAELGARELVSVSPIGVQRLLNRAGFLVNGSAPVTVNGERLFACRIGALECQAHPMWFASARCRRANGIR